MNRQSTGARKVACEIGRVFMAVFAVCGTVMSFPSFATDSWHASSDENLKHDVRRTLHELCPRIRLFYGKPDVRAPRRVEGPDRKRCDRAFERDLLATRQLDEMRYNLTLELKATDNPEQQELLRNRIATLNHEADFEKGRVCRSLFRPSPSRDPERGRLTCMFGVSASHRGIGGLLLEYGDRQILGYGPVVPQKCTDWPLRESPETPLFRKLAAALPKLPSQWSDMVARVSSAGFRCDPVRAHCTALSDFVSVRGSEMPALGSFYLSVRVVAAGKTSSDWRTTSPDNLQALGADAQLCVGIFQF